MIYGAVGLLLLSYSGIGGLSKVSRDYLNGNLLGSRTILWIILTAGGGVGLVSGFGLLSIHRFGGLIIK